MTRGQRVFALAFAAVIALGAMPACQAAACRQGVERCDDFISVEPIETAVTVSVETSKQQFRATEAVTVRVTVVNKLSRLFGYPAEPCAEPIEVIWKGNTYPVVTICSGESIPGAQLGPGQSMVYTRNLVPLIQKAVKTTEPGQYCVFGRVTNLRGRLNESTAVSAPVCVQILAP